jgi:hypothetical protein
MTTTTLKVALIGPKTSGKTRIANHVCPSHLYPCPSSFDHFHQCHTYSTCSCCPVVGIRITVSLSFEQLAGLQGATEVKYEPTVGVR